MNLRTSFKLSPEDEFTYIVIKLKKKAHSNKLLPLSQALKFIASDTLNLDAKMKNKMTNGEFSTPT